MSTNMETWEWSKTQMHPDKMVYGRHARTAILGLPTSERLKVMTLNCAVWISHESPKLMDKESYNMVRHDGN